MLGSLAVLGFVTAYAAAMAEERLRLRKSVPVLIAAGLLWVLVGLSYAASGRSGEVLELAQQTLLDFAELLLFLVPAMTFVNTLEDLHLFDVLRAWLVRRCLSLRAVFWVTGGLAFMISPLADNLTTALLLGAVVMSVGRDDPRFVLLACINIVVAANAGGAFSPFGDITTLMVWQAGHIHFLAFFALLVPSLVNWLVPALILSMAVRQGRPRASLEAGGSNLEPATLAVLGLFLLTIAMTVILHSALNLPSALGMMAGLGLLKAFSYVYNRRQPAPDFVDEPDDVFAAAIEDSPGIVMAPPGSVATAMREVTIRATRPAARRQLDIFALLERIEWDTLLFFYGVLMGVGALGAFGYLAASSQVLYGAGADPTLANVAVGLLSAIVDNVPVMFAVLNMNPSMSEGQWLLVTLTAGVGGSLLSIGSAAGVALMGQARGAYTFGSHLRWTWAVALGYVASVVAHLLVNAHLFG
jgi:Na+/H+ antiporter NhaD/arsenite permease-like protein